jgi:Spy/CpxP family protein refolding chaperone
MSPWLDMRPNRFAARVAVLAGILVLCAAPGLTRAQSSQPGAVPIPHRASPAARAKRDIGPTDYFAGLKFTDEQKAKIDEIHKKMKSRTDAVVSDQRLDAEQKGAMLEGFRRMENGQVFKLLTPQQQNQVRDRIRSQRAAEQDAKRKLQSPPK